MSGLSAFRTLGKAQPFRLAEAGSGPVVVLLHGFPDTPQSWESTARLLADEGYRVVVPYLRGYHPDTVVPGRRYGVREIGDDVLTLLDELGLESAVLVGHDWGAASVWSAAELAPDRVDALVAVAIPHTATVKPSPALLWRGRHFAGLKVPGAAARIQRGEMAYVEKLYRRWAPSWSGPERDATVARATACLSDAETLRHALAWYRDLALKPPSRPAQPFPFPGMLVAGSEDFGGDLRPYERSRRLFAAPARLLVADRAGHWPHREQAEQFHAALLDFLGELER